MKKNFNLKAAIKAGTAAGLISGLVKLGWEDVLPPRTPERNATYTYSDQEMPWVSFIVHFGFSVSFGIIYEVLVENSQYLKKGYGTIFGLAVWVAFHLGIMPAMGTVPSAKEQPKEEHLSEALGHIAWMWTNDIVGRELYRRLTEAKQEQKA